MRQPLKIKCWNCENVFTISAELSRKPDLLVETEVPCPFCEAANQISIDTDQVKSGVSYRDGQSSEAIDFSRPGVLLDRIFKGVPPPPPSSGQSYYPPRPIPDPSPEPTPPDKERSK
ncbi:MAG TPA: hypothetical protein PK880_13565 [Candidatus Competibacter sp.]|nr:hypothetical protein [Candidatus Competibacter sp.]